MAERVTRNREVLGLHYLSDGVAGKKLAELVWPLLAACPTIHAPNGNEGGLFDKDQGLLDMARKEWP